MATVSTTATITDARTHRTHWSVRRKLAARTGIVAGALLAAALLLPASLASWADVDHTGWAVRIAPWNASIAADAAAAVSRNPRDPKVRALVRKALSRDATQVQAIELRALDLVVSGEPTKARELFRLSDRLSRRSLPTRLWLIQDSVDRGDVTGALRNFDIALRTTTDAQPVLFPVLTKASADATLTVPLARTLDRPSDWRLMFVDWALSNAADVAPVANVVAQMRDARFVTANNLDQLLIGRLITSGKFEQAALLNRRFGHPVSGVADPKFADASARYPFGWGLVSNGSIGAERALSGSSTVLNYRAAPANSGQVAAQLLLLRPGSYVLETQTAATARGTAPYWSITCGNAGGAELARLDQPSLANGRAETSFSVPTGCRGQWLTLRLRPAVDSSEQAGAISWVAISPR